MASRNMTTNSTSESTLTVACPVCDKSFEKDVVEDHVNRCLFLNTSEKSSSKRNSSHFNTVSPNEKRIKVDSVNQNINKGNTLKIKEPSSSAASSSKESTPLAERMRPVFLDDIVGQISAFGSGTMLRSLLEQKKVPNMILWGPPGCGKTSLANVVATLCKEQSNMRYVKLSAAMSGINDVKEVVKVAKNEAQFKRHTVLFMDEIHRFNKLQQDTFLPHVENGTITLVGATTENPSFSLNNALLSRCRVVVLDKLTVDDVMLILKRALERDSDALIATCEEPEKMRTDIVPKYIVEEGSLQWLAEVCDGDARVALGALELALSAQGPVDVSVSGPALISLDNIKDGIKRSHMLYDRRGEEHYNTVSAIHKSIRASDDNAALYWTTRALHGGEDPLFIARRLIRAACEDIGLADSNAVVEAVACLQGCQHIGMPECDVLLVQCAVRLARAPKSQEVYRAMNKCKQLLNEAKGPLPPIPLHLRNAPTKLMKDLGYGRGYNLLHKDDSGLTYMPEGLENLDLFQDGE